MVFCICPNPSIDSYAWINSFRIGGVNRYQKVQEFPGGKGVHVSLAVAELGEPSKLLGFWAGDAGKWIKNECAARDVEIAPFEIPGNNRKCYTFISENTDLNHTELLGPGPELTEPNFERFIEVFREESKMADLVCMSGSWPANAPEDGYAKLIRVAKKSKRKVILDCTGNQLHEALKENFFGIHLNHHEANDLCGSSDIVTLHKFLGDKVELIALTKGKDGLELAFKNTVVKARINLNPEEIVSTVGSGDCLTAGIAFALKNNMHISEIAAWGAACGTANCLNKDLGMLKKKDVEKMLKQVEIETYVQ